MISDMSIPPPPPLLFAGGGALAGLPDLRVADLFGLAGFCVVFEGERVVAVKRVGTGGGGAEVGGGGTLLWAGLVMEGMGVEGRGGGEEGVSS